MAGSSSSRARRPPPTNLRPSGAGPKPKPSTQARPTNANVRVARARQRRQRNRMLAFGAVGVVVVVLAVVIIIGVSSSGNSNKQTTVVTPANAAVVAQINSVPVSVLLQAAAANTKSNKVTAIKGPAETVGGKPLVLYVGAEYCPYCAATRWAMVMALSKFGTIHNLGATTSSSTDLDPNTPTFTFYKTTYSSKYLTLQTVELTTRNETQVLQKPTKAQSALLDKFDPGGGIPFIYFNGKQLLDQAPYDPAVLQGKSYATIASEVADPNTAIGKNIDATAGDFIKAICQVTGAKPANVCSAAT